MSRPKCLVQRLILKMRTLVVSFDELMATLHSGEQQLSLNDLNFAHIYRLKAWLMRHWQSVIRNHGSSSPVARIAKPEQMTYLAIWKDLLLSNFPVINLFWPWPTPPSRPTPTWWWRRSMRLGDRMADSCLFSALIHYSHWRIVMCRPWLGLKAPALAWLKTALACWNHGPSQKPKLGLGLAWLWLKPGLAKVKS